MEKLNKIENVVEKVEKVEKSEYIFLDTNVNSQYARFIEGLKSTSKSTSNSDTMRERFLLGLKEKAKMGKLKEKSANLEQSPQKVVEDTFVVEQPKVLQEVAEIIETGNPDTMQKALDMLKSQNIRLEKVHTSEHSMMTQRILEEGRLSIKALEEAIAVEQPKVLPTVAKIIETGNPDTMQKALEIMKSENIWLECAQTSDHSKVKQRILEEGRLSIKALEESIAAKEDSKAVHESIMSCKKNIQEIPRILFEEIEHWYQSIDISSLILESRGLIGTVVVSAIVVYSFKSTFIRYCYKTANVFKK